MEAHLFGLALRDDLTLPDIIAGKVIGLNPDDGFREGHVIRAGWHILLQEAHLVLGRRGSRLVNHFCNYGCGIRC